MNKGLAQLQAKQFSEAINTFQELAKKRPSEPDIYASLSEAFYHLGNHQKAEELIDKSLTLNHNHAKANYAKAYFLHKRNDQKAAITHINSAANLMPQDIETISLKGNILTELYRYSDAIKTYELALKIAPTNASLWNNYGNVLQRVGLLDESVSAYEKALELPKTSTLPFSNMLTSVHYHPGYCKERITMLCKEWNTRYAPSCPPERPQRWRPSAAARLRIGMLSNGFRNHPVGQMTISALEHISTQNIEIYLYSTSNQVDHITVRFQSIAKQWMSVEHMDDLRFAQQVRDDQIDILIDLAGHNAGNRMLSMTMQPAPLLVKWVGGLINTTGIKSIDYLISDTIETPTGCDADYSEKLIRLPNDYICYDIPSYAPAVASLPAARNGFVTFGCFNNASKVNEVILAEWAKIMSEVANSRLYLKSLQYDSPELRSRIISLMAEHNIPSERLRLEGPSPHPALLQAYNNVDIALDPWPYSGGLTTCEALLMGVPVVTLPGPTFAGRHSATHLINARMPELVVNNWEEYRARVIELASDMQSLSTIRSHLRETLLQSPVCDTPRFARNFTNAMRAIWQRYCEGKQPAALTLDQEGQAWFEGDSQPMQLQHPVPAADREQNSFNFKFEGKVVTLDNGALLVGSSGFSSLHKLGAFATIAFDPASKVVNAAQLQTAGELHHYPHITLGDGRKGTLFACLAPAMTSTLEPLPAEQQLPGNQEATQVIAKLPITTLRLDDIEGLENIDWLLLDNMNDSLAILENGEKALANTLLVQARVNFVPTHKQQPELTQISHWLSRHGFSFYRLNNLQHYSHLPKRDELPKQQATQLVCTDALFTPNAKRMASLTDNQKLKLAFVLHSVYGIQDLTHKLISLADHKTAERYLADQNLLVQAADAHNRSADDGSPKAGSEVFRIDFNDRDNGEVRIDFDLGAPHPEPARVQSKIAGRFVHICFNNMHIQQFINLIQKEEARAGFQHSILIERARSVPGYDVDIRNAPQAAYFDSRTQLDQVLEHCLEPDVLGVFFHGLFFDWQKNLVEKIGNQKKTIWVIWGGDLYSSLRSKRPISVVDLYIDAVATFEKSEYDLFCKHHGPKKLIELKYGFEFEENSRNPEKENTIFVGNSGDPSNNHIDILRSIAGKRDISHYEIVIPFSYSGSPEYLEQVKTEACRLNLKNVKFIEKIMPKSEYLKQLEKAKLLVTAHDRQQALGNITAAIYYGTAVVAKREISVDGQRTTNPTWEHMAIKNQIRMTDYDDFKASDSIGELLGSLGEQADQNRERIKSIFGSQEVAGLIGKAFRQAHALPNQD